MTVAGSYVNFIMSAVACKEGPRQARLWNGTAEIPLNHMRTQDENASGLNEERSQVDVEKRGADAQGE